MATSRTPRRISHEWGFCRLFLRMQVNCWNQPSLMPLPRWMATFPVRLILSPSLIPHVFTRAHSTEITESAPSGTPSPVSTDSYGVAQATASYGLVGDESKMSNSAGRGAMTSDVGWELSLLGLAVWGAFWVSFMV